jgi:hypothetical protein
MSSFVPYVPFVAISSFFYGHRKHKNNKIAHSHAPTPVNPPAPCQT